MDKEAVAGAIIMVLCCFGCGMLFWSIGAWAEKSEKPMGFWSGSKVDPEKVTDIPAYNHANAVMWKTYALSFWLSGVIGCLGFLGEAFTMAAAILMTLACFPGMFFLVFRYRKIEKQYITK